MTPGLYIVVTLR